MYGIIIEGVVGAGKTTTLKHLEAIFTREQGGSSKLYLSEHYTLRALEFERNLGEYDWELAKLHLNKIVDTLTELNQLRSESKAMSNHHDSDLLVVLERFILSHLVLLESANKPYKEGDISQIYQKLSNLGLHQIILKVPEEDLPPRLLSTLDHRSDRWKNRWNARGTNEENIAHHLEWQRKLLKLAQFSATIIPTTIIDIKNDNYLGYAEQIYNTLVIVES